LAESAARSGVPDCVSGWLLVKMRQEGRVENRAIFVAVGVNLDGNKEVLGLWTSATEGAKFW